MKEIWIKWDGGKCPVADGNKMVEVEFRNGEKSDGDDASGWNWKHFKAHDYDIIAFRFIDDARDNWVDVFSFKSCPVDPETLLEFKNTDMNITYTKVAKDYNSWGCSGEGVRFFRIIKEEKKDEDDWIEWHGGECPVDEDSKVLVKYRGIVVNEHIPDAAKTWEWNHIGSSGDIVAYKIVKEQKPQKSQKEITIKSSKKVDLIWGSW